ncbi:hypothetical protein K1719_025632 [Acacia pycnantha]|nr:hypothetical protein K1719_025632 [Acacia pycnantha]
MSSLPCSVAITATPEREPDFRKSSPSSLPGEKSPSISFQKSHRFTHLDGSLETRHLDFREALSALKEGRAVDTSFYAPLLQECLDKGSVSDAQIVHGHMVKTGTHEDVFVMAFLVNVYAKCKNIESARKVFDNMPRRNVISWTTLMAGYVQNSQPENAIQVFQEMLDAGSYPSNYSLAIALNASYTPNVADWIML